jgi:hypothetical protein
MLMNGLDKRRLPQLVNGTDFGKLKPGQGGGVRCSMTLTVQIAVTRFLTSQPSELSGGTSPPR